MHAYQSPYRPLDWGWLQPKQTPANFDDLIGVPWTPQQVFVFKDELPAPFVRQWDLKEVPLPDNFQSKH